MAEDPHAQPEHELPVLNPDCTRELVIDVPAEDVSKRFRAITREFQSQARIPGFRPGKTPESVIRRRFAKEIQNQILNDLVNQRFNREIRENGLRPVGEPQVTALTLEDGEPLHFRAIFECLPEFSVDGYQDVTVEKPEAHVTEEEYQAELLALRGSRATIEPVEEDRALVRGDLAQVTFSGRIEGEPDAPPVTGEDILVDIGGKDTVPAFSEALTGARPGQELTLEVSYPSDYPGSELAGRTVAYEITVKAIKRRVLPELNDEFAREVSRYESLGELEVQLRRSLLGRRQRAVANETKERLIARLLERYPFPVPESLVQELVDHRLEQGLRSLAAQGMTTEQMRKLDFARLRAASRDAAVGEARSQLLIDRIATAEGVTVTSEELDQQIQLLALQSREPVESVRERLTEEDGLARIREQLKREKTAELLYERLPA